MRAPSRLRVASVALAAILAVSSLAMGFVIHPYRAAGVPSRSPIASGDENPPLTGSARVVSALSVVRTISVGSDPSAIAYDSANNCIYVANEGDLNVTVISGATGSVVANIEVGKGPDGIAYDSATGDIYVANSISSNVTVIDGATNSVVDWIHYTGALPAGITYDSSNGDIYSANWGTGNVTVINGDSVHSWITVGANDSRPDGVDYDSTNGNVYVAVLGSNQAQDASPGYLSVIHGATNSEAYRLAAGSGPDAVADSGPSGQVYVANYYSRNVTVINGGNGSFYLGSVPVGYAPDAEVYDPFSHQIFVANEASGNVTVIGTTGDRVVANLPVGSEPDALAFDSSNGDVYVANAGSNTVSIIAPGTAYTVSFTEMGLPSGVTWSVTMDGTIEAAPAGSNITFVEPNGTYFFSTGKIPNYSAKPSQGDVKVYGANVTVSVAFDQIYAVTFREAGLPHGFGWNVSLNGTTQYSTLPNATFEITNGTYPFASYSSAQDSKGSFYRPQPLVGNVTVDGSNVTVPISFRAVYTSLWGEIGLPNGTRWSMTVNGTTYDGVAGVTNVYFFVTNGTYAVTVNAPVGYVAGPPSFTLAIDGPTTYPAFQSLYFHPTLQNVTFSDSPLPSGTIWYVNLTNGQSFSTDSSEVTFQEPDGTYYFTIVSTNKEFVPSPSSGSFTVNGTISITETVNFSAAPSSASTASSGLDWTLLAVVLVIAAVAVSVLIISRSRRRA